MLLETYTAAPGPSASLIVMILILLVLPVYFVPSLIAFKRHHRQKTAIMILNIFLGWTFIGWVIALVWSVMKEKPSDI